MRRLLAALALLFGLLAGRAAFAHEVRPAYLEIDQTGPSTYTAIWKQPVMGDVAIHLIPHLSNGWLDQPPGDQYATGGFLIRQWTVTAAGPSPLAGRTLSIEGLQDTITDVFVRIRLKNGEGVDTIVRPEAPQFRIDLKAGAPTAVSAFLLLGVEHILTGPDHLLFVLGLLLIVRDRWMLLKTVSAFTVAHSLTLAAATLGHIQLSTPLLNALIALSILFVAPEALRAARGGTSLTIRYPWIVAFAFGLLHGMGFANGLSTLGLEKGALLGALALFNVGVEIGQLMFLAVVLALIRAFRLMQLTWPRPVAALPAYAIGALGAMWTFQYSAILLGAT
ncbi:HupE/UreJ family protein [Phenylobacterium sp.]|uniref:HupE/UreJ family protein n=1 Tax=Phenylobacterium sp. TaxID=1871053 RepID=UPI0012056232|nr:HupE/UreJ family protein [Phenylobacterium sp.]THD59897.1 MAG: HupE/UreJ family protein [Phenylobacterium sp.]